MTKGRLTKALFVICALLLMLCSVMSLSGCIGGQRQISTIDDLSKLFGNVDFDQLRIDEIKVEHGAIYVLCSGPSDEIQFEAHDSFPSPYFIENTLE